MTVPVHGMPKRLFDALAAGGGGAEAVRKLAAAQYSKHVILLRGVLVAAEAADHELAKLARQGFDLLTVVQQHARAAADAVIKYPSVGAWALQATRNLHRGSAGKDDGPTAPAAEPSGLFWVAAAAAIRAGLTAEIDAPVVDGVIVLPSLGVARVDAERVTVRTAGDGASIGWPDGTIELSSDGSASAAWSGLRHIKAGSVDLVIDDVDPFRMPAAPHQGARLSSAEARSWNEDFQRAWQLLEQHHPLIAAEFAEATSVIVPLLAPAAGRVSSSSPETFGAIALSRPPDTCTLAVTLAHELQHIKLSALIDIAPLTLPDTEERFYAPWRPDPRPVSGLLQGAYAFLGVSDFWRRQRELEIGEAAVRAHAEFARWRLAAEKAVETLQSSGRLTAAGLEFVHEMARTLGAWADDPVPEEARALARHEAEQHLATWQSNNGPVSTAQVAAS
jgi:uncharacterized protein